ncbi:MAG: hypothetical protein KDJ17_12010 [Hyphomicrobiaceae bacterium]|nr:hypothetical protein [Hyphomicrobiaceae bacterium]
MARNSNSTAVRSVNFVVGFALLVMLFPVANKPVEKPAGVRTAVEMVSKKLTLRTVPVLAFDAP